MTNEWRLVSIPVQSPKLNHHSLDSDHNWTVSYSLFLFLRLLSNSCFIICMMFSLNTVLARLPQPGDREGGVGRNDGHVMLRTERNSEARMREFAVIGDLMNSFNANQKHTINITSTSV